MGSKSRALTLTPLGFLTKPLRPPQDMMNGTLERKKKAAGAELVMEPWMAEAKETGKVAGRKLTPDERKRIKEFDQAVQGRGGTLQTSTGILGILLDIHFRSIRRLAYSPARRARSGRGSCSELKRCAPPQRLRTKRPRCASGWRRSCAP